MIELQQLSSCFLRQSLKNSSLGSTISRLFDLCIAQLLPFQTRQGGLPQPVLKMPSNATRMGILELIRQMSPAVC